MQNYSNEKLISLYKYIYIKKDNYISKIKRTKIKNLSIHIQ